MAGADVAVTDGRIADLVIEYAMRLGRAGTTDTVTMPVARNGRPEEATLLIGPASQIALTDNEDVSLAAVELPPVDELLADLRRRIQALAGVGGSVTEEDAHEGTSFIDFDTFD